MFGPKLVLLVSKPMPKEMDFQTSYETRIIIIRTLLLISGKITQIPADAEESTKAVDRFLTHLSIERMTCKGKGKQLTCTG